MVNIHLPDGSTRSFLEDSVNGFLVANSISKSLAKKALAMKVNGILKDLTHELEHEDQVSIITTDSEEGLDIIRHDAAHVLAQAVKELYPKIQVTIGPTIKDGFYYDFATENPFSLEDLEKIEKKMKEIIGRNEKFARKTVSREEAIKYFDSIGENYKVQIIRDLPGEEEISIYSQGEDFTDLCRGPHGPSTTYIKAFKLMKVAGAYWRGDSKNQMLQRIYGTAWANEEQLTDYLNKIAEAERRDHRVLVKDMDLCHFQEEAPGAVFWHPKGWTLFQTLVTYMKEKQKELGYQEISTPEVLDRCLWEASGHWEKFGPNMFTVQAPNEDKAYAIRPMNCPGGVQVFKHGLVSYRDLPMKLSEFGRVHRYEPSGSLHGLMRVRTFIQDDAHIFCQEDQILSESQAVCESMIQIYKDFGFDEVMIKFADRPEKRVGSDEIWDKAETALLQALESMGLKYSKNPGEGAFYGPKLEFTLRDAIGRDWQMGTLQVDLNMPERLGATYIGSDGSRHHPVMLHRAVFGSLERFTGMLLEHYAGHLPLWLAPIQLVILTVSDIVKDYALTIEEKARHLKIKVILDDSNETLNYKLRKHILAKAPLIAVIGKKEVETGTLSLRKRGSDKQEVINWEEALNKIKDETSRV